MINQVLTYLSGSFNKGHPSKYFSAPATQVQGVQYTTIMSPNKDASLETCMFPRLTTGPIMTIDHHDLFINFLKLKPSVFMGIESEHDYDFVVDCYNLIHKWT